MGVVAITQETKLTVLVDVDDVINNLCQTWIDWLNEKYEKDVQYDDIDQWNMNKYYPDLTEEEIRSPLFEEEFWRKVLPRFDAIKYLNLLIEEGYEVYLVTSSYYQSIVPKYENLIRRYYPFIDWEHIIIAYKKQMIKGDVLVDDGVHNLEGGTYMKILMTAPHNKDYDTAANGMFRANNWGEIYAIIHGER